MSNVTADELRREVEKAGLQLEDHGNGHFRIIGGKAAVNYYPFSRHRTAHVDGSKGGVKHCDVRQAINLARQNLDPSQMQSNYQRQPGERHDPVARAAAREAEQASTLTPPWN